MARRSEFLGGLRGRAGKQAGDRLFDDLGERRHADTRGSRSRPASAARVAACRTAVWKAIDDAGTAIAKRQGTEAPDLWRSDADAERLGFAPGLLSTKIRYTNRPSGIQQVISFSGHRSKRD